MKYKGGEEGESQHRAASNNNRYRSTVVLLDDCGTVKKNAAKLCRAADWNADK